MLCLSYSYSRKIRIITEEMLEIFQANSSRSLSHQASSQVLKSSVSLAVVRCRDPGDSSRLNTATAADAIAHLAPAVS